ncbi:MAG: ACT domain-containing protein [Clostridia bacterium]|jgi:ACT domain-containing protein|nr:ACT domain-containing protein [Clostridia bacterium]MCX4367530.1 ACT domain-containing protein [Clostridia bacterium]
MKAIVSVIGKDKKGIIAKVSAKLYDMDINVEDISQTILQDHFTMIMMVSLDDTNESFSSIADVLKKTGEENGVEIRIQHEDIFNSMHKI